MVRQQLRHIEHLFEGVDLNHPGLSEHRVDSGFRRGTDILKALGLGAKFVFIGRPFNYASALAGEAGVDHAIGLLRTQLRADLGMLGLLSLQEMNSDLLFLDNFKAVGQP